jgi:predicted ATPase
MPAQVFLSYSRRDLAQATAWVERLRAAGLSVWFDQGGIDAAHLWTQEIFAGIQGCKVMALLASRASVASEQVVREVTLALQENKRILPLMLEPVQIPPSLQYPLAGIQYLELFRGTPEEQLETILRALKRLGVEIEEPVAGVAASPAAPATAAPAAPAPPASAPAPETARTSPHNLPRLPTSFVGREAQLAAWYERLSQPETRVLTLLGLGGMGKTRAALQLAQCCLQAGDFPDGIWYIGLEEAKSGEEIMYQIAAALALPPQPQTPVPEQVCTFLRERELLLVLDNTEQIADAARVVYALLDAPDVKCLVTTRKGLGLSLEQIVEVPPLPPEDAERLFVERARSRMFDFAATADNAPDIAELCRRLEGLPLAIELAASRIVGMTPREILDRLTERFRLLQTRAPDLPARQRALRGTMDWSHDLLHPEGQSLLAELAVFARRFTLAHAEKVSASTDVMEDVAELRLHSLVSAETDSTTQQTYFVMLESVHEYAAEKLLAFPDTGRAVRQRHAEYFRRFAEAQIRKVRTPEEARALQQFDIDHDNIQAALDWSRQSQQDDLCAAIALPLGIFHQRRGFQQRALQQIRIGMDAVQRLPEASTLLRAQLQRELASLYVDQGNLGAARNCAFDALLLFDELGDTRGVADVGNLLGLVEFKEGNLVEARDHFTAALEQFEQIDDRTGIACVRNNLGLVETTDERGDKEEAARQFTELLRLHRENGDQRGMAEAACNLGMLAQQEGEAEVAWRCYNEALQCGRDLGDKYCVGRELSNLGEVAELQGNPELACRLFSAADSLFTALGAPEAQYTADLFSRVTESLQYPALAVDALRQGARGKSLAELIAWALAGGDSATAEVRG